MAKNNSHTKVVTYEEVEQQVRTALAIDDQVQLKAAVAHEHPSNLAAVIDRLNHQQRHQVFALLTPAQAPKVLDELSIEATRQLLDDLSAQEIGALLDRMPMDEAAEILTEDYPQREQELLAAMSPARGEQVQALLRYPKHSAGRLMTHKFAQVRPDLSAAEALTYLREINADVETLTNLYVLNDEAQLIGVVSLREVVTAPPERTLAELMNTDLVTVTPETDREEVAHLVSHYDYLALPVVTQDKHMLGIIPVDRVIDVLVSESTEDILRFGGMEGGGTIDQPYFTVALPLVIRKRVGWLLLLFLAETLTGNVLRIFEGELSKVVALSFFIPLLIGTGGNTGAQTVSTLIRGLALGEIQMRDIWRVLRRELLSGFLLGILLGTVGFVRTLLWGNGAPIALIVGLTILAICTWANTVGALIPMVAHKLKIDPAVVSAPLITTLVDATGLAIYMLIAKLILGL
ncbi:MAG TPA: magnesium transporter [Anaerolineae bacterium]|nr:magnesium transporter [Anaerolineae bacterium]